MGNPQAIWNYEVKEAEGMARQLLDRNTDPITSRSAISAGGLLNRFRHGRKLKTTRDNLLFTKQLAFDAAREIFQGQDRETRMRSIAAKTKGLLDQDKEGVYTDKIRRKQVREISLLTDHYLGLLQTEEKSYPQMIRTAYQTPERYRSFLDSLEKAEHEVIQASISTVRRGSKMDRVRWFDKVKQVCREARQRELAEIFRL
jgi:hypothetical protein